MRFPGKLAVLALLPLILGSCSPEFPLDIISRDGRLVFTTEREWKWFIIPHRPKAELCSIDVFDAERYIWRVKGKGDHCLKNGIPIAYGEPHPQLETIVKAVPLVAGRRYGVEVLSWADASRNFTIVSGRELKVQFHKRGEGKWISDPEQVAFARKRSRRLKELREKGLSEEEAMERWANEAFPVTYETHNATAAPASAADPATSR